MKATTDKQKQSALASWFEWMSMFIGALVAVVIIFAMLFRVVGVDGQSMRDTLQHRDFLVMITRFYTLERGDIAVIYREGEEPLIKRVIGVAGDTIEINEENGCVYRNGKKLKDAYVLGGVTPTFGFDEPYTVRKGEIFVMGDNRSDSLDSRQLGAFSIDDVMGKAVYRLFPFATRGKL